MSSEEEVEEDKADEGENVHGDEAEDADQGGVNLGGTVRELWMTMWSMMLTIGLLAQGVMSGALCQAVSFSHFSIGT